jgi:N-acylneuraminate cytidylyltransferase
MGEQVTAIIPARGGSKGVPGKNLRPVGGLSLVARSVLAARGASEVDRVVVSSDASDIIDEAVRHEAEGLLRPEELSQDASSSESALIHAVETLGLHDDVLVFLQCTSPFVASAKIDEAVRIVRSDEADTAFSATSFHGFLWKADGTADGHDIKRRPRRQELEPRWLESGGFYVLRARDLLASGTRFNGRIRPVEVDVIESLEIDTYQQLLLAQATADVLTRR